MPKPGPLPQTSQTLATVDSLRTGSVRRSSSTCARRQSGQPEQSNARATGAAKPRVTGAAAPGAVSSGGAPRAADLGGGSQPTRRNGGERARRAGRRCVCARGATTAVEPASTPTATRSTRSTCSRSPTPTPAPTCSPPCAPPIARSPTAGATDAVDAARARSGRRRGARRARQLRLHRLPAAARARRRAPPGLHGATRTVAAGLDRGADLARAAVADPVEGTILTVARARRPPTAALADGATGVRLGDVVARPWSRPPTPRCSAPRAARRARRRRAWSTPAAAGSCLMLDALARTVTGAGVAARRRSGCRCARPSPTRDRSMPTGHRYEVQYLLDAGADQRVDRAAGRLSALGDSVAVVRTGDATRWNVHVHVDDVGAAIEAGIEAGRPHRITVVARRSMTRPRPRTRVAERGARGRARRRAGAPVRARGRARRRATGPRPALRRRRRRGDRRHRRARRRAAAQRRAGHRRRRGRRGTQLRDDGVRVAVVPTRSPGAGPGRGRRARPGPPLRRRRRRDGRGRRGDPVRRGDHRRQPRR